MSNRSTSQARSTSSKVTRKSTENLYNIDMVGMISHQITGAKLPSNRQILQTLFYNTRIVKLAKRESAKLTIDAALIFWAQARIPTRYPSRCVDKLIELHDTWRNIGRTVPEKRSAAQKQAAQEFTDGLDDLFDIATTDAIDTMRIQEDKDFLTMQRKKGRPGMAGIDRVLFGRQKRSEERKEKEEERKLKRCSSVPSVDDDFIRRNEFTYKRISLFSSFPRCYFIYSDFSLNKR